MITDLSKKSVELLEEFVCRSISAFASIPFSLKIPMEDGGGKMGDWWAGIDMSKVKVHYPYK